MLEHLTDALTKAALFAAPEAWWVGAIALILLSAAAAIDARSGRIPDILVLPGVAIVTFGRGIYNGMPEADDRLLQGFIAAALVWVINQIWRRLTGNHALGMGDGKWSWLAVTTFGPLSVAVAWGIGACLASMRIIVGHIRGEPTVYVHFAPYLMIGLALALTMRLNNPLMPF